MKFLSFSEAMAIYLDKIKLLFQYYIKYISHVQYQIALYTLILFPCIYTGRKYAIFFHIAYFDITYFRAFFTCVAMYKNILHPAISQKSKYERPPLL